MEIITIRPDVTLNKTAVVLGNFDGVHMGHKLLLEKAKEIAKQEQLAVAVFTFNPHPSYVIDGKKPVDLIYTREEKINVMAYEQVDYYLELSFDETIANLSPIDFIEQILIKQLGARVIVVGADYRFGKHRLGDYRMLVDYAMTHELDVIVAHKLKHDGRDISSTWIREEIAKGNLGLVAHLLGRPYSITGEVVHGKQLGTRLGFPTANIIPASEKILPPNGVYISKAYVGGKEYKAITNIGLKPTVDGKMFSVEVYILDFRSDIYGRKIRVELYEFMRSEKKFNSIESLVYQIKLDVQQMKSYFEIK